MADNEQITAFQSFSDRTLKYGRNMMVATLPIIVFAFVPDLEIKELRPLNYKFPPGNEIWIWNMMLVMLIYYAMRFYGLAIPDFLQWRQSHGSQLSGRKNNLVEYVKRKNIAQDRLAKEDPNTNSHNSLTNAVKVEQKKYGKPATLCLIIAGDGPISGLPIFRCPPCFSPLRCGGPTLKLIAL